MGIALAAGVSKAAVSKVLHDASGSVRVSEERAAQIRALTREMGYIPNANVRILRRSRTHTVGVYFENLTGIASGPLDTVHLLDGVCQEVFGRHHRVTFLAELDQTGTIHSLGDGRLDGVIWSKVVRDADTARVIEECPLPIVALNAPKLAATSSAIVVRCDAAGGMEAAIEHLWNLGHRRIMFLHEDTEATNSDCVDRLEGFRQAMERRGVALASDDIAAWSWDLDEFPGWCQPTSPYGDRRLERKLRGPPVTALRGMRSQVPSQLSVIGFDSTQYCEITKPPLTAVRQPIQEMGLLAARLLIATIEGERPEQTAHVLPCPSTFAKKHVRSPKLARPTPSGKAVASVRARSRVVCRRLACPGSRRRGR